MENQYDLQYWQDKLARWKEHKEKQDYTQSDENVDKIIEDCETQIEIAKAYYRGVDDFKEKIIDLIRDRDKRDYSDKCEISVDDILVIDELLTS